MGILRFLGLYFAYTIAGTLVVATVGAIFPPVMMIPAFVVVVLLMSWAMVRHVDREGL